MSRRTYEKDADFVEVADDLENLVADKRISWRASATKARRRQRRKAAAKRRVSYREWFSFVLGTAANRKLRVVD